MSFSIDKYGGSSMTDQEQVQGRVQEQEQPADVVVVSAPGVDEHHPVKLTQLLINYGQDPSPSNSDAALDRIGTLASLVNGASFGEKFIDKASKELKDFADNHWPVEALGEHWSAEIFAKLSGREYLDPRVNTVFTNDGKLDEDASLLAIKKNVIPGHKYVYPGFFGASPDGAIHVLPRGGSDVTGALAAKALSASVYRNWSDVPGFMSADPRLVGKDVAQYLHRITYREARELGNNGNGLLQPMVPMMLGTSDITTIMCNTFDGQHGTEISKSRDWKDSPIIGITGELAIKLSLHKYGMNEESGETTQLFELLTDRAIPYSHAATGLDDVSVLINESFANVVDMAKLEDTLGEGYSRKSVATLHLVGEGIVGTNRMKHYSMFSAALEAADIEAHGFTDTGESPGMTYFITPDQYLDGLKAAHSVIAKHLS